jgi:hypothetical protein
MERLLVLFAGLLAVLLVPLGLSGPTAMMVPAVHLGFALVVCAGATLEGVDGRPGPTRWWSIAYLVATLAMVVALEIGTLAHGARSSWSVPWAFLLVWGWIPPLVVAAAGALGRLRERRHEDSPSARTVRVPGIAA